MKFSAAVMRNQIEILHLARELVKIGAEAYDKVNIVLVADYLQSREKFGNVFLVHIRVFQDAVYKYCVYVVVGAYYSIKKAYIFIAVRYFIIVVHTHDSDFVNQIIHQALILVYEHYVTVASLGVAVREVYHRLGFSGALVTYEKIYHVNSFTVTPALK
jgi:hypothetical protein